MARVAARVLVLAFVALSKISRCISVTAAPVSTKAVTRFPFTSHTAKTASLVLALATFQGFSPTGDCTAGFTSGTNPPCSRFPGCFPGCFHTGGSHFSWVARCLFPAVFRGVRSVFPTFPWPNSANSLHVRPRYILQLAPAVELHVNFIGSHVDFFSHTLVVFHHGKCFQFQCCLEGSIESSGRRLADTQA